MKRAFFALVVLILSVNASAIEWNVPDEIPVNVNWSAYADFGGASYDKVQVLLDGEKVYETSWGSEYIELQKVVSARYYDTQKKLALSFSGLTETVHTVEIKLLRQGELVDSVQQDVKAFMPGSSEMINQTKENFTSMRAALDRLEQDMESKLATVDSMNASLESLQSGLSALEGELSGSGTTISSLQQSIDSLKRDISALSESLSAFSAEAGEKDLEIESTVSQVRESLSEVEGKVEEILNPPSGVFGFFSFVAGNPFLAVSLIIVIIAVIIFLLLRKKGGSGMLFETGELESEVHEVEAHEPEEEAESPKGRGKWAHGKREKEGKKYGFTDLLWKKK